jgi:hypothetical protein
LPTTEPIESSLDNARRLARLFERYGVGDAVSAVCAIYYATVDREVPRGIRGHVKAIDVLGCAPLVDVEWECDPPLCQTTSAENLIPLGRKPTWLIVRTPNHFAPGAGVMVIERAAVEEAIRADLGARCAFCGTIYAEHGPASPHDNPAAGCRAFTYGEPKP